MKCRSCGERENSALINLYFGKIRVKPSETSSESIADIHVREDSSWTELFIVEIMNSNWVLDMYLMVGPSRFLVCFLSGTGEESG